MAESQTTAPEGSQADGKLLVAEPKATAAGGSQASQPAGAQPSASQAAQLAEVADEPVSGGAAVPAMDTWRHDGEWWGDEWSSGQQSGWWKPRADN